jgi:hypothetical protein
MRKHFTLIKSQNINSFHIIIQQVVIDHIKSHKFYKTITPSIEIEDNTTIINRNTNN